MNVKVGSWLENLRVPLKAITITPLGAERDYHSVPLVLKWYAMCKSVTVKQNRFTQVDLAFIYRESYIVYKEPVREIQLLKRYFANKLYCKNWVSYIYI